MSSSKASKAASKASKVASTLFSMAGSVATSLVLLKSLKPFIPDETQRYIDRGIYHLVSYFTTPKLTLIIPEYDGLVNNEVYEAAEIYLGGRINPTTRFLRLSKPRREKCLKVTMEKGEEVEEEFDGANFEWRLVSKKLGKNIVQSSKDPKAVLRQPEVRFFELTFNAVEKDKALESYIPYVVNKAKAIAVEKKTLKLFTVDYDGLYESLGDAWRPVYLEHPSTFDTLALDPTLKKTILDDLEGFVKRKEYYKSVGKAWKRGYLLYGPPGTGKSSLIAAMANYLNFDIYDLDLTELEMNSELRKLMVATANRSILVVEDIDCGINLQNRVKDAIQQRRRRQLTLSGVLNFIDGLWSSCGDERIIIFTTNYKEKLDPALLRAGRMDMHIHLSYCTPGAFDVLAMNYLKINQHPRFEDVRQLIEKVEVTPADVAEKLMKNDTADVVLQELIDFLEAKRIEQEEARAKEAAKKTEGQEEKQTQEEKESRDEDLKAGEDGDDDEFFSDTNGDEE